MQMDGYLKFVIGTFFFHTVNKTKHFKWLVSTEQYAFFYEKDLGCLGASEEEVEVGGGNFFKKG